METDGKSIRTNPRNDAPEGDERIRTAEQGLGADPVYDVRGRRIPQTGDTWRSRDPRDNGLQIQVLAVENGYVRIQRFRKTTVGLPRFHREYEFIREVAA